MMSFYIPTIKYLCEQCMKYHYDIESGGHSDHSVINPPQCHTISVVCTLLFLVITLAPEMHT